MKILICACWLFGILITSSAFAKEESWYFNLGLGYGIATYPAAVEPSMNALNSIGATHSPIALDLGFYFPLPNRQTIIGPAIHGMNDNYEILGLRIGVVQTGFFCSVLHSLGSEPGTGFLLRGELGGSRVAVDTNFTGSSASDFGVGGLLGLGYGFLLSEETRITLTANYSTSKVEDETYAHTSFIVGFLF